MTVSEAQKRAFKKYNQSQKYKTARDAFYVRKGLTTGYDYSKKYYYLKKMLIEQGRLFDCINFT